MKTLNKDRMGDYPGGPVVKSPCSYCRGHKLNPWVGRGTKIPHAISMAKN